MPAAVATAGGEHPTAGREHRGWSPGPAIAGVVAAGAALAAGELPSAIAREPVSPVTAVSNEFIDRFAGALKGALGDALQLPAWVVQRAWSALLLVVALEGLRRLALRALGVPQAVALVGALAYDDKNRNPYFLDHPSLHNPF